jgi:alkylated DNA repair dioxygenase AlkB
MSSTGQLVPGLEHIQLRYIPDFLGKQAADEALAFLLESAEWAQREVKVYGKIYPQPRLTAWYGDPEASYTYSGLTWEPLPWLPLLATWREQLQQALGVPFNSVLLNLYRTGQDKMGWHADDEKELGPDPVIASISLGAERRFQIRPKDKSTPSVNIPLGHGSLLVMGSGVQQRYSHALPAAAKIDLPRINLTYRQIYA